VAGGFAAAKIVVVQGGQVIVNQRIGVNHFDGAGRMQRGGNIGREYPGGLNAKDRANALAAGKNTIAHGLMNGSESSGYLWQEFFERGVYCETVFFKEFREFHRGGSGMRHSVQSRLKTDFLFPTLFRARTAQQQVCRRPSSAESRHGFPLLRVVSGILAKAPRLPQIISWLHQEQAAGSRGGARLLRGALATSRNPVSWAALVFEKSLARLEETFSYNRSKRHSKSRWRLQTIDYGTWRQGAGFNVKVCLRAPASATSLNG